MGQSEVARNLHLTFNLGSRCSIVFRRS
uniref:BLTX757 n=1 Tax=Nephila pilipes TaxID=299642 RepID=A0A076L0D9_NEPPI|nr:BLTX757 [Nephila pilipes]